MSTVEDRITILETEFRTELRHLATKTDLKSVELQMAILMLSVGAISTGAIIATLKLWV